MKITFHEIANKASSDHLEDYLIRVGIPIKKPFRCLNPQHEDVHPSMSYWKEGSRCKCFSCNAMYDLFDVIGIVEGITDKGTQLKRAIELFPDISEYAKSSSQSYSNNRALGWNDTIGGPSHASDEIVQRTTADGLLLPNSNDNRTAEQVKHDADLFRILSKADAETYAQWEKRGISKYTVDRYHLGYDNNYSHYMRGSGEGAFSGYHAPILSIPNPENESYGVLRNLAPTETSPRYQSRGPKSNYNTAVLRNPEIETVFIVEGEIDGLSLAEIGFHNFVSLGSAGMDNKLIDTLMNDPAINNKTLVLLMDNDTEANNFRGQQTGRKLKEAIQRMGKGLSVYYPDEMEFYPKGVKDPNEFLLQDREGFNQKLNRIVTELEEIKKEEAEKVKKDYIWDNSVLSFLDEYKANLGMVGVSPIYPTKFSCFDGAYLDGGLHGGTLITIGALSSAGKTTLIHQMADQLAENGTRVLFFSLEMSKEEIVSKSISRLTYLISQERKLGAWYAKTLHGITDGMKYDRYTMEELELINDAVKRYEKTIAQNMHIIEGMGDVSVIPAGYDQPSIREVIEKCVQCTGDKPVIIVDYLQILAPYNERATDKQNMDKSILELKRIARDYDVPVIAISSMNRDSYSGPIDLTSFKESGAIEYSSDILLGLQFLGQSEKVTKKSSNGKTTTIKYAVDIEESKQSNPRKMELRLLKNRNGSMRINTIYYDYYPMFNTFEEKGTEKPSELLEWEADVTKGKALDWNDKIGGKKSKSKSSDTDEDE